MRAAPLSPQVKIYLQQDRPLLVKYEMGSSGKNNLGEAVFALAPQYDDEEGEQEEEEAEGEEEAEQAAPVQPLPAAKVTSRHRQGDATKKRKARTPSAEPERCPEADADPEPDQEDGEPPEWD